MKLKALLLTLAVLGLAASFGLTANGRSDTGTTTTTTATTTTTSTTTTTTATTTTNAAPGDACRRFELQGTLTAVSASSFTVSVKHANKAGRGLGSTATIAVGADTRVSWSGRGTLTGPNAGDSVRVNGSLCGSTLTARTVQARGPKPDKQGGADQAGDDKDAGPASTHEHGKNHK